MPDILDWSSFLPSFSRAAGIQGFSAEVLIETEDGPVIAWERKGAGDPVYLSAGIHGDEPAGPLAALKLMETGAFPADRHCIVCPALNPGGLALNTRENRNGIDLNRDYLNKVSLETSAHARWLDGKPVPGLFVSLHEDWETAGFYFYEINLGMDDPRRASELLAAVSPHFPGEPGLEIDGHAVRAPGWIFHCAEADLPDSWPEAIYLAKRGCPLSFTLETPSRARLTDRVSAHVSGFSSLLRQMG
jgi:protein MpaA